jgi:hypothetical protein
VRWRRLGVSAESIAFYGSNSDMYSYTEEFMSQKEFEAFKEAAANIELECDTPEKVREVLIEVGYLDPDGQVVE